MSITGSSVDFRELKTEQAMSTKLFLAIFILHQASVWAWPGGAPPEACENFIPQHGVELKDHDTAEFFLHFKAGKARGKVVAKTTRNGVLPIKVFFSINLVHFLNFWVKLGQLKA